MRVHRLALFCAALMGIGTEQAHAYLDPGTGSMLLQGLLAALAGLVVAMGSFRAAVSRLWPFRRRKKASDGLVNKH